MIAVMLCLFVIGIIKLKLVLNVVFGFANTLVIILWFIIIILIFQFLILRFVQLLFLIPIFGMDLMLILNLKRLMMTSKNKHGVYISFDINDFDAFQRLYPDCYKEFIKRSVNLAIQDRSFFDSVFFNQSILAPSVRIK